MYKRMVIALLFILILIVMSQMIYADGPDEAEFIEPTPQDEIFWSPISPVGHQATVAATPAPASAWWGPGGEYLEMFRLRRW